MATTTSQCRHKVTGDRYTVHHPAGGFTVTGIQGPMPADGSLPPGIAPSTSDWAEDGDGVWPIHRDAATLARFRQMDADGQIIW